MTDYPDAPPPQGAGAGAGGTGGTRRPRTGDGGAPVSGALAIVLAIVAVVAGFFILRAITDDGDNGDVATGDITFDDGSSTTTTLSAAATTTAAPATTTEPPLVTEGATVVVANANNVNGSAGQMTRALEAVGFTMGEATNASASTGQLEETVVYFDTEVAAAEAVAESVARALGGVNSISPLSVPAPTESGETDAGVLVLLGVDKAGKTLEELNPSTTDDGSSTVSAPEVSGTDETGTDETGTDETGTDETGTDDTGDGAGDT